MILLKESSPAAHTRGGYFTLTKTTGSVTLNSGAGTQDVAGFVPAESLELAYLARVDTAVTTVTSWDVGLDGDTNRYGATLALALGTTVNPGDYAGDWQIGWVTAADAIRFTGNGGNLTAGVVRHELLYMTVSDLHA